MSQLRWLTNEPKVISQYNVLTYDNESPLDAVKRKQEWRKDKIIGRPKATDLCSTEQLEAMGLIGIYTTQEPTP